MKDSKIITHVREWSEAEWRTLLHIPAGERVDHVSLQAIETGTRKEPSLDRHLIITTMENL